MLKIRKEQAESLSRKAQEGFECRVRAHLRRVFRRQCEQIGEPAVRESIRRGIKVAGTYGVKTEYDVVRFIDLEYILCEGFDINPEMPWTAGILNDEDLTPAQKLDRLYERVKRRAAARRA